MGVSSGSIVVTHQNQSFPAQFAKAVGITDFQQPLVSEPGISPELKLFSLSPLIIAPKASASGNPTNLNLPRPYDNMAIAGAKVCDLLTKTRSSSASDPTDLVLRQQGFTQIQQALSLHPTFVLVHIGGNDVLGAVLSGMAIEGVTLTSVAQFQGCYHSLLGAIASVGAKMAVSVPPIRVEQAPYANAVAPYATLPNGTKVYFLGTRGDGTPFQLGPGDFLALPAAQLLAQGIGVPTALPGGTGQPLPNSVVLDKDEVFAINERAQQFYNVIQSETNAAGGAFVDENALANSLFFAPQPIGGVTVGVSFLTGGFYGYDGFHPTNLGYGLLTNLYIDAINEKFGSDIPEVDLSANLFGKSGQLDEAVGGDFIFTNEARVALLKMMNLPQWVIDGQSQPPRRRPGRHH
jgi:lysophospholipase L1-like esterase